MKIFGYLIIALGFIAGALVSVLDELNVQWNYFIGAFAVGVAGVVMVRLSERRISRSEEKLTANLQTVETGLRHIAENISRLNAQKQSMNLYDVHKRVDELLRDHLAQFVTARRSLAHAYGLQEYAEVMSHFASGERYINRVWSASVDGYADEVAEYLDRAQTQFTEALNKVNQLKEKSYSMGIS
jgi:hypothetical protein